MVDDSSLFDLFSTQESSDTQSRSATAARAVTDTGTVSHERREDAAVNVLAALEDLEATSQQIVGSHELLSGDSASINSSTSKPKNTKKRTTKDRDKTTKTTKTKPKKSRVSVSKSSLPSNAGDYSILSPSSKLAAGDSSISSRRNSGEDDNIQSSEEGRSDEEVNSDSHHRNKNKNTHAQSTDSGKSDNADSGGDGSMLDMLAQLENDTQSILQQRTV